MLLSLMLFACGGATPEAPAPAPPPPSTPVEATEKPLPEPAAQELHPHMQQHLEVVSAARDALLVGNVDAAKEKMSWLAHHEPAEGMAREWAPYAEAMRKAAREASRASEVDTIALGVASAARQCGACHGALGKGPHYEVVPLAAEGDSQHLHMLRHQEASDAMWLGLVSADDAQWARGAEALAGQEALKGLKHPGGEPTPEALKVLGKRVHELGAEGLTTMDWDARAQLVGELIGTCAGCHVEEKVGQE